ncbi:hypothetical protein D1F64_07750 [Breoghania sp. L-A4]|nr:hypothetical protein D1F64_07750 [Breoghania sp. L-A4]
MWHACAREVAGSPAAVVSSELFSRTLGAVSAGPILDAFAQWTVVPVIYLRRQDQFLEAAYNYNVKANGVTADIMTFAEEFAWRLDYVRLLEELERAFGRSTLRVRIYGRELVGGDTVSDFLSAIGLPFDDALRRPQVALNRGLTRDGMTLMLAANRRHADAPDALAAARREIVAANPAAAHTEHSMLSRTQRQAILSRYKAGNAAIAAAHFGRRVLFRDEYPRAVRQA